MVSCNSGRCWNHRRFGSVATGFKIGGLTLSPMGLASGLLSFFAALWIVRAVQRWLNERFLPKTEWDAGVRFDEGRLRAALAQLQVQGRQARGPGGAVLRGHHQPPRAPSRSAHTGREGEQERV